MKQALVSKSERKAHLDTVSQVLNSGSSSIKFALFEVADASSARAVCSKRHSVVDFTGD